MNYPIVHRNENADSENDYDITPMILEKKLKFTLKTITDLVRTINLVSINASISASHMEKYGDEGKAFKVIAKEIHDISSKSLNDIDGLGDILGEVQYLSKTINIAGSLRMLSQKIMKLYLILSYDVAVSTENELLKSDYGKTIARFEEVIGIIKECHLNTSTVHQMIEKTEIEWTIFLDLLNKRETLGSINQNDVLLLNLQALVSEYESLAG